MPDETNAALRKLVEVQKAEIKRLQTENNQLVDACNEFLGALRKIETDAANIQKKVMEKPVKTT